MASIISAKSHLHILAVIRLVGHVGVGAEVAVERRELERLILLPPFTGLVPIGSLLALSEFIIICNPNPLLIPWDPFFCGDGVDVVRCLRNISTNVPSHLLLLRHLLLSDSQ